MRSRGPNQELEALVERSHDLMQEAARQSERLKRNLLEIRVEEFKRQVLVGKIRHNWQRLELGVRETPAKRTSGKRPADRAPRSETYAERRMMHLPTVH